MSKDSAKSQPQPYIIVPPGTAVITRVPVSSLSAEHQQLLKDLRKA